MNNKFKKIICLLIAFISIFSLGVSLPKLFSNNIEAVNALTISGINGSGRSSSPLLIENNNQWSSLVGEFNNGTSSSGIYIKIINDLDLTDQDPIEEFNGTINGDFYTITVGGKGFIKINRGTISNCIFKGNGVTSYTYGNNLCLTRLAKDVDSGYLPTIYSFWGAVASVNYGTIEYCGVTDIIVSNDRSKLCFIGGISGYNAGTITNCYAYKLKLFALFNAQYAHIDNNDYAELDSTINTYESAEDYKDAAMGRGEVKNAPVDLLSINAVGGIVGYLHNGKIASCVTAENEMNSSSFYYMDHSVWFVDGELLREYKLNEHLVYDPTKLTGGIFGFCAVKPYYTFSGSYIDNLIYAHKEEYDYEMTILLFLSSPRDLVNTPVKVSKCYTDFEQDTIIFQKDHGHVKRGIYKNCIIGNIYDDIVATYSEDFSPMKITQLTPKYINILQDCYALFYEDYESNNINTSDLGITISTGKIVTISNNDKYAMYGALSTTDSSSTEYYSNLQFKVNPNSETIKNDLLSLDSKWSNEITLTSGTYPCFTANVNGFKVNLTYYYATSNTGDSTTTGKIETVCDDSGKISSFPNALNSAITNITYDNRNYTLDGYVLDTCDYVDGKLSSNNILYLNNDTSSSNVTEVQDCEIIYYENSTLKTLTYDGFTENASYNVYPVYKEIVNTIYFNYNNVISTSITMPKVTIPKDMSENSTQDISYGDLSKKAIIYGNTFEYSLKVTNSCFATEDSDYYIFWVVHPVGGSIYKALASSLGKNGSTVDIDLTLDDLSSINYSGNEEEISWDLKPGVTQYVVHFQAFPKVTITLNANAKSGDTVKVDGKSINSNGQTVYSLLGTNILYYNDYEDPSDYKMKSGNGYTLMGFFNDENGTKEVLNSAYGIVGDGKYFDSNHKCKYTENTFELWAKWESNDICTITIKYEGPNISNQVYYFYYKITSNSDLPNKYSNEIGCGSQVTFDTVIEGYTYKGASYYGDELSFLSTRWDAHFITNSKDELKDFSGTHNINIYLQFDSNETEDPGGDDTENVCIITVVYDGCDQGDETYYFYYLEADTKGNLGYADYVCIEAPTGYEIYDDPYVSGESDKFLQYAYDWAFKTRTKSELSSVTGTYEITLTYTCIRVITIELTFNYEFSYEYAGRTYYYDLDSQTGTWYLSGSGDTYSIPDPAWGYSVTDATINSSETSYSVRKNFTINSSLKIVAKDNLSLSYSSTYSMTIDCTGTLEVTDEQETTETVSVKFTGVYYKGFNKENDYELGSLNNSTSGRYDSSQSLYEYTFTNNYVKIKGKAQYIVTPSGNVMIDDSFNVTGYNIPDSVLSTIQGKAGLTFSGVEVQYLIKPNGYIYNSTSWVDGTTKSTKGTAISFNTNVSDATLAKQMKNNRKLYIYQDWQYANYTITVNKNKYTSLDSIPYTAGSNVSAPSTITSGGKTYNISGWYITSASIANNDSGYKISTTEGFKTAISASDKYEFADYTYSKSNLMYGNFTIEPIFDDSSSDGQTLVFDFGITKAEYVIGYSKAQVYGTKQDNGEYKFDEIVKGSDNVTFEYELTSLNDTIDLFEILNKDYEKIPKFYQDGDVKYYLVGWTGASYKGTYIADNLEKIYLYDRDEIPGNVVTDSPNADGTGTIYAVWATLYEIRVGLTEEEGATSSNNKKQVTLYNGSSVVQIADDLQLEEQWQDSYYNSTNTNPKDIKYYYTFFYGETLTNNQDITLYFDPETAIGSTPDTPGYSLSYKYYDVIESLGALSLQTLKGYKIYGKKGTTNYYINSSGNGTTTKTEEKDNLYINYEVSGQTAKVDFNDFVLLLVKSGVSSDIYIMPEWEETYFYVTVNGDKNFDGTNGEDVEAIRNYKHTFPVKATEEFNFWTDDSNDSEKIENFKGWYLDTLTDVNSNKLWSYTEEITIDNVTETITTAMPIGKDFYNKILAVNGNKVQQIYTINVNSNDDIFGLKLEFNASYIGAIYALEIINIDSNGKSLSLVENSNSTGLYILTKVNSYGTIAGGLDKSYNSNGEFVDNTGTSAVIRLLPKYQYVSTGKYGIDNSKAFEQYKNKLFAFNGAYYITLQDKATFSEADFKQLATLKSTFYSLDFYDYSSKQTNKTNTTYHHECYDISSISIDDETNKFTTDSGYGDNFVVNSKCNWVFDSAGRGYTDNTKQIYARWIRKVYNLNMAVNFNGIDTNSGYLVAEIDENNDGKTVSYYAYVYLKDESGAGTHKIYKLSSLSGTFYKTKGWKDTVSSANIEDTNILEVPAGGKVTITAYGQDKDIYLDDMIGYRFTSVDITNPYSTVKFTCEVNKNTYIDFISYEGEEENKKCYYSSSTAASSSNYISSTGLVTTFDLTNATFNQGLELRDEIKFVANLEKIVYSLITEMDDYSAGTLSYSYNKDTGYGLKSFTLNDITVGDNLKVAYNSSLGYQIIGWSFTNNLGTTTTDETTSLVWTDGQDSTKQLINASFLKDYVYKGLTSYSIDKKQVLGEVKPSTSKIEFTLKVTIYNNVTLDMLDSYSITDSSKLVSLSSGTKLILDENYQLNLNLTDKSSYKCYVNNSIDYAVIRMYLADKNLREYMLEEYDFPITNYTSLDFDVTTTVLDKLVHYTAGVPVSSYNREINAVVFVAPIVAINTVDNETLLANTDPDDLKFGHRELKANNVVLASAEDGQVLTKQNTQYAYVGQKVKFNINTIDTKFYKGADITVDQNGIKQNQFTLNSGGGQEITIVDNCTVNIKFVPATFDLSVNFLYKGQYYDIASYNEILNLANVEILTKAAEFIITDTNGNVRGTKFYYGDILSLTFGKGNFNEIFIRNDTLTEYTYSVFVNGVKSYARAGNYTTDLLKSTNVVIEIIDLTSAVTVETNIKECGLIYGVSKSNITEQIGNGAVGFDLIAGDELNIYLKVSTGYRFLNYSYKEVEKTVTPILIEEGQYEGYMMFTLISNYMSELGGAYTLNFEEIMFNVELVYIVEDKINNNAGLGYEINSSSVGIKDEITISNSSNKSIANEGYRFIGYTVGKTSYDGQKVIENGSYQVTIKLSDYAEYIDQVNEKVIIYINFIRQYKIVVGNRGNDFSQTKVSLCEGSNYVFKDYSMVKLPYASTYIDSSNFSKLEYKLVVDVKSGLDMYYINLYCNNSLVEDVVKTKNSFNGNASSLEYVFKLDSNEFNTYNFAIEYMPESLTTTLKEYYIDNITQVEDYINNNNLPEAHEHVLLNSEIGSNVAFAPTNVNITFTSTNNNLVNRYNVVHNFRITLNEQYGYSIYQVWVNDKLVLDTNNKTTNYNGSWLIESNSEVKVIYKKLYNVYG